MKLSHSLFIAAITFAAFGCSSSSDTGTDGGTTDSGTASDTTTPTDTGSNTDTGSATDTKVTPDTAGCQTCAASNCSTELAACLADDPCKAGVACLEGCDPSDAACKNACVTTAHGETGSDTKIDDVVTCLQAHCATECGF